MIRGKWIRVASLESDGIDFPDNPAAVIRDLKAAKAGLDVFTFVQTLPHTSPEFPYRMEWDNVAALEISTFDHWFTKQIDFKVRNKARKGEKKGLVVREVPFDDALVQGISGIYNEAPVRQGKRFWHYGKSLEQVKRENASFIDRSIVIGAYLDARLIGFLKLVIAADGSQATVLQILSLLSERDKAPTNALIMQGVRSCAERGIPYFVYANFSYGKKKRDSLADFKESNGFRKIDVPRYYVPLSMKGEIAIRTGFHHRLAERIPEPVLEKAREARNRFNARRFAAPKEVA
jgi:hypothetical protein